MVVQASHSLAVVRVLVFLFVALFLLELLRVHHEQHTHRDGLFLCRRDWCAKLDYHYEHRNNDDQENKGDQDVKVLLGQRKAFLLVVLVFDVLAKEPRNDAVSDLEYALYPERAQVDYQQIAARHDIV